jgi:hypothetical protein
MFMSGSELSVSLAAGNFNIKATANLTEYGKLKATMYADPKNCMNV